MFSIEEIRQAGIDGEISSIDIEHLISILLEKLDKNRNPNIVRHV